MKTQISPSGSLDLLSQLEVERLKKAASNEWYQLYRSCSLAVLNTGLHIDDSEQLMAANADFDLDIIRNERGIKLDLNAPPEHAFVDGKLIKTIRNHLFSVLRDIVFLNVQLPADQPTPAHLDSTTDLVFNMLRNAKALPTKVDPDIVVCWGGHSINKIEYAYTRAVGEALGLRGLNICTGCGTGAMEGPMKGAAIGHSMQCSTSPRFIGLSEPSIIASEPPNPVVNELIIMPDIEKRLEAFVRLGHGIVIFPGGPGTAEELLYILGILMHPKNADQPLPVVLTGPKESEAYFRSIDQFLKDTLGDAAQKHYQIVIDDPQTVAQIMKSSMTDIKAYRKANEDAYSFNWSLHIADDFQLPFIPTHESMGALDLHLEQAPEQLAANLRKAFSGIVAGNIKADGIKEIEQHGPFILHGDPKLMEKMDVLLGDFVQQQRMKLPGSEYHPCYKIEV